MLVQDILTAIGCHQNAYKFGNTKVFFRPKNEKFVDILRNLNPTMCKNIGREISVRFKYRQRHAIWISLRFIGSSKFQCIVYTSFTKSHLLS